MVGEHELFACNAVSFKSFEFLSYTPREKSSKGKHAGFEYRTILDVTAIRLRKRKEVDNEEGWLRGRVEDEGLEN